MDYKKIRSALAVHVLENATIGSEIHRGNRDSLVRVCQHGSEYHGRKLTSFTTTKGKKNDETRLKGLCDRLANLRHPNIVQFIGVSFCTVPVVVSEALPFSLASALDDYSRFPESVQLSILSDVARALAYLHSPPKLTFHGDLTARNIFLTRGLQAKIGDLGVAHMFDPSIPRVSVTMTKSLEAAAYAAPEIHKKPFCLTSCVDVFSFGVLALHIGSGRCPIPIEDLPSGIAASEFNRRKQFIDFMKPEHCLIQIIKNCLTDEPNGRPTSPQLLKKCEELSSSTPLPFNSSLELIHRMERREGELIAMVERLEVEQNEVAGIGKQLNSYDKQLTAVKEQMKTMEHELADNIHDMPLHQALNKILLPQRDASRTSIAVIDDDTVSTKVNTRLKPTQTVFQWKSSPKAPVGMRGATSVVLEGKLYIGGGECKNFQTDCTVYEYDITGLVHKWTPLPICPVAYFALGIVNRSLVLIGGLEVSTRRVSNQLYLWDREKQDWVPSLPKMPTARQQPSASMYDLLLIVAGGYRNKEVLGDVEVFDQATFQWQTIPHLPIPCAGATSCVVRDVLYLMGGTLYANSGPQTTVQAIHLSGSMGNETWKLCKDAPLTLSCAVPASNFVLAVGGSYLGSTVPNRAIHVYFPSLDRWELLCEMSTARHLCTAAVLSAGKLFICGGREEKTHPVEYGDTIELLMV